MLAGRLRKARSLRAARRSWGGLCFADGSHEKKVDAAFRNEYARANETFDRTGGDRLLGRPTGERQFGHRCGRCNAIHETVAEADDCSRQEDL